MLSVIHIFNSPSPRPPPRPWGACGAPMSWPPIRGPKRSPCRWCPWLGDERGNERGNEATWTTKVTRETERNMVVLMWGILRANMRGFEDLARMARKNRRIAEDLAIYLAISAANWRIRLKKIEIKTSELRILSTKLNLSDKNGNWTSKHGGKYTGYGSY